MEGKKREKGKRKSKNEDNNYEGKSGDRIFEKRVMRKKERTIKSTRNSLNLKCNILSIIMESR